MRAFSRAVLWGAALLLACAPRYPIDREYLDLPRRTVSGRLEDLVSKQPIGKASVLLAGPGGKLWAVGKSKRDGTFSFTVPDVEGHRLRLRVLHDDYDTVDVRIPEGDRLLVLRLPRTNQAWRHQPGPEWVEALAPGLHVVSNVGETDAREVLAELERFRAILRFAVGEGDPTVEPSLPLSVYVVREEKDLRALAPQAFHGRTVTLGGLFQRWQYGVDIFVVVGHRDAAGTLPDLEKKIRHEYHHLYYDRAAPWAPLWLREGMAEVWSSARHSRGRLLVGQIDPDDVHYLRAARMLSIAELLAVDESSSEYRSHAHSGVFYAQSALFTHYLLFGIPDGEAKLRGFGHEVQSGTPALEAARKVWGDPRLLEARFDAYLNLGKFPYEAKPEIPIPPGPELTFTPVDEGRRAVLTAWALVKGADPSEAEAAVEAAREARGDDPLLLDTAAFALAREGGDLRAHDAAFLAASRNPGAGIAVHHLALLSAPRKPDGTPRDRARFETHVRRLRELAPRFPEGLAAEAALLVSSDPERARALALEAIRHAPDDPVFEIRAARIFRATGLREDAEHLAKRATLHARTHARFAVAARVCDAGARAGFAAIVGPACDRAVALSPNDWRARDVRSVQRALTGDIAGALDDVQRVLATTTPDFAPYRESRAVLLRQLQKRKEKGKAVLPQEIGISVSLFD